MNLSKIKGILTFAVLLTLFSCTLEEPALPTWLAEWSIPFESSYTMEEVLTDSNFVADTTGSGVPIIALSISDSMEKKTVSPEDLSIKPEGEESGKNIEDLSLGTIGPVSSNAITLEDLVGGSVSVGDSINIPDTDVPLDLIYILYKEVGYAHIENGTMQLELVNNTIFDIREGTQISIFDDSTNTLLGDAIISQPINSMQSGFAPDLNLSDMNIHTKFLFQLQIPFAAKIAVLDSNDLKSSVWVNGILRDLEVYEATAMFPEQSLSIEDSSSVMEEDHRIRYAEIEQGNINIFLENRLAVTARAFVTMPNFKHLFTGEIYTDLIEIPANTTMEESVSLANYSISDYTAPGDLVNYIKYEISVTTDSSENFVRISQNDSVMITVEPESLLFSRIDGVINSLEIEIDPVEKDDLGDLSDLEGSIFLDSLEMDTTFYNETGLPIDITLFISGSDGSEELVLAPIKAEIPPVEENDGILKLNLSGRDAHPNIIDLMGILPTNIRLDATAFVDGEGTVTVGQTVSGDYQIYSPLFLRIDEPSILKSDITREEIDENDRENIKNNLKSSSFFIDLLNGLPVGAEASIYISTDSTTLFDDNFIDDSTRFSISDKQMLAGQVGPDGYVDEPSTNKISQELTDDQLRVFYNNSILYFGTKLTLYKTDGLVKFRLKDEISLQGDFRFQYQMNNDSNDSEGNWK
jgi:hypothetical protein